MSWKTDNTDHLTVSGKTVSLENTENKANAIWSEEAGAGVTVWRFREWFIELTN